MFATGVWFEEGEVTNTRWAKLEELLVMSANGGTLPVVYRPTVQLYTNKTENKFSPVAFVRGKIHAVVLIIFCVGKEDRRATC